jgi:class 3 adenylate cyclase
MLFIDIRESTKIIDGFRRETGAKMYKSFLWGVTHIARMNDGEICSFNGDGVLIAFAGDYKRSHSTKAAMQMGWFAENILKPKLHSYFEDNQELDEMKFNFGIGVDVGNVLVVRGGIRGENNNDLVWVGNATNYAVKFSGIDDGELYHIFIGEDVYKKLNEDSKYIINGNQKTDMWENRTWEGVTVYRSKILWKLPE